MATTTPRIGLYQPADDGSEPVDVATDLNNNLEKIDASVGFVPSTDTTLPATTFNGMARYETNTLRAFFLRGATWTQLLSAGATFASNVLLGTANKIGIGNATPTAIIDTVVTTITAAPLLRFKQASEANHRLQIDADGIRMGPGTAITDTRIYRSAASQITIDGNVAMSNNLNVVGAANLGGNLTVSGDLLVDGVVNGDFTVAGRLLTTGVGGETIIRRDTAVSVLNDITPNADAVLRFTALPNATYQVWAYLIFSAANTVDFRTSWTIPTGAVGLRMAMGPGSASTGSDNISMRTGTHLPTTEVVYGTNSEALYSGCMEVVNFQTAATGGLVTLNWAQGVVSTTLPSWLREGSLIVIRRIT